MTSEWRAYYTTHGGANSEKNERYVYFTHGQQYTYKAHT